MKISFKFIFVPKHVPELHLDQVWGMIYAQFWKAEIGFFYSYRKGDILIDSKQIKDESLKNN